MADLLLDRPWTVTVVHPGPFDTASLFLPDPFQPVTGEITQLAPTLWQVTVQPSTAFTLHPVEGEGTLILDQVTGDVRVELPVTIGRGLGHGTMVEAVVRLATKLHPVWIGQAQDGTEQTLTDPTLAMGGSPVGWFCLRTTGPEIGQFRRVTAFDPPVLFLDLPFLTPLVSGEPYVLVQVRPDLLRTAIEGAIRGIGHTARVPLKAVDLPLTGSYTTVPQGWEAVTRVWGWVDGVLTLLPPSFWTLKPGRTLELIGRGATLGLATVTVEGFRSGRPPALWTAELDLDLETVVTQAAVDLYLSGAGGPAIDPEDRMRKTVLALQEAEGLRRARRSRVPSGARLVVE